MCKLTKSFAHPGGCWIFMIQGENLTGEGNAEKSSEKL